MIVANRWFAAAVYLAGLHMPESRLGQERVRAVDIYGSSALARQALDSIAGADLRTLASLYDSRSSEAFRELEAQVASRIRAASGVAVVEISIVEMYTPGRPLYVTVDLVDEADVGRRLPFASKPDERLEDPAGLLASWLEYERTSGALFRDGALPDIRARAHHSLWGFSHPTLEPFGARFDRDVPRQKAALVEVLRRDADDRRRASAAFLLAQLEDPDELIGILTPSMKDPSPLVRNNGMRVLASVARLHPRVPLEPVITALDYPMTTDRNKALAIVRFLVETDEAKRLVKQRAGRQLLAMLRLQQPANHTLAHVVLQRISGESYGARDYQSWEMWLAKDN